MQDDFIIKHIREVIRQQEEMPAAEWFQVLIDRGVIDEKGNVLIRMPHPPEEPSSSSTPPAASVVNGTVGTTSSHVAGTSTTQDTPIPQP
jgi:hypothetical protein